MLTEADGAHERNGAAPRRIGEMHGADDVPKGAVRKGRPVTKSAVLMYGDI